MSRKFTNFAFFILLIAVSIFTVIIINVSERSKTAPMKIVTPDDSGFDDSEAGGAYDDSSRPEVTTAPVIEEPEITSPATTKIEFPMDINEADKAALMSVSGIGEKLAESIEEYINSHRPITNMDMLLEVNGIGEGKLNDLKKYFYVSPELTEVTSAAPDTTTAAKTDPHSPKSSKTAAAVTSPAETEPQVRTKVNINTATAEELMRCLLITQEQAEEIVSLREQFGGYQNALEILYCESISDSLFIELEDYLET